MFKKVLNAGKKAFKHLQEKGSYKPEDIKEKPYRDLIQATYEVFNTSITDNVISPTLKRALQNDAFLFGGLKTHAQLFEASKLLLDENGNIKSGTKLQEELDKLNVEYNQNYLEAEYQFAVQSSIAADQWERSSDRYNLQYRTASDDRVREEHRALHGITLPKDDPFWMEYYPPNGWRCRCRAIQVRKEKYQESNSEEAQEKGKKATSQIGKDGKNRLEIFRFNPGLSLKLMPPEHPYNKVQGVNEVKSVMAMLSIKPDRYSGYEFAPQKDIENGVLEVFTSGRQNKQEFVKNKRALTILANKGHQYRMLPVIEDGSKNPDAFNLLTKRFVDIKVGESTNGKNIIQSALKEASKQNATEVVIHFTKKLSSNRVAYDSLKATFSQGRARSIKNVIFIMQDNRIINVETKRFK